MTATAHGVAIRIGHHKCGSDFLNYTVFPRHSQIHHLGKPYDQDDPVRELVDRVIDARPFDAARCRAIAEASVRPYADAALVTISDGRIAHCAGKPGSVVPERLRELLGPCRIVLNVRRHLDFVRSLYAQLYGVGVTDRPFSRWIEENWSAGEGLRDYMSFTPVVTAFARAFGDDAVHVVPLERMRAERGAMVGELAAFLGIDGGELAALFAAPPSNERMSPLQARLARMPGAYAAARAVGRRLPRGLYGLGARLTGHDRRFEPDIPPRWRAEIDAVAATDTAALATLTGLPMQRWGYGAPAGSEAP